MYDLMSGLIFLILFIAGIFILYKKEDLKRSILHNDDTHRQIDKLETRIIFIFGFTLATMAIFINNIGYNPALINESFVNQTKIEIVNGSEIMINETVMAINVGFDKSLDNLAGLIFMLSISLMLQVGSYFVIRSEDKFASYFISRTFHDISIICIIAAFLCYFFNQFLIILQLNGNYIYAAFGVTFAFLIILVFAFNLSFDEMFRWQPLKDTFLGKQIELKKKKIKYKK